MESKAYRLKTVADIFAKIPVDRIDAFLADLGAGMKSFHALKELANTQVDMSEFDWIDDGKNDQEFSIYACEKAEVRIEV